MFGTSSRSGEGRNGRGGRGRSGRGSDAAAVPALRRRGRGFRPGRGGPAFDILEERQLLNGSNDLTAQIDNLLSNGTTSGSVALSNVTLGNFLSSGDVTVSFQNISQQGSDWSGTVTVTTDSASLALGSAFSAKVTGDASNAEALSGAYDLNNKPLGQGAYALTANHVDATVSNLLTANASGVQLAYDPGGPTGQQLAHVTSASATFTGIGGTTATLNNLDIFDNGFKLEDGSVSPADFSLGGILSVTKPSLTFSGVAYTVGSNPAGTVGLSAGSASLFSGQKAFSATVDNLQGTYSLASSTLGLTADDVMLTMGQVLKADATGLSLAYDPSATSPLTVTATSATLTSPEFPKVSATVTSFQADNTGLSIGNATLATTPATTPVDLGGVVDVTGLTVAVDNFKYSSSPAAGQPSFAGTVSIAATSASLFSGQKAFSATVDNFHGSYDLNAQALSLTADDVMLTMGQILKADATGLSITYDPNAASPMVVSAKSIDLTSPEFSKVEATVTDFQADNTGLSIGDATLSTTPATTPVQLGGILSVTGLSVGVSGFKYNAAPASGQPQFSGTIHVGAASASLFPGQSLFTASVTNFHGSYNLNTQALSLSADDATVSIAQILKADATGVSIAYDPSAASPVVVSAKSVDLTSPEFPNIEATVTAFQADNTGLSIGDATLASTPPTAAVSIGSVLSATGLSVGVSGFKYNAAPASGQPQFSGTIHIGAGSASLFPGQTSFTASVTNFQGSYDLNAQALHLSADEADLAVSSALKLTAKNLSFGLQPMPTGESVTVTVGSATATFPQFGGVNGTITGLAINNDGFSIQSASVNDPNTVSYGTLFSIADPTFTFTSFGYTLSQGAKFDGTLGFSAKEVDINKGGSASLNATGVSGSLGFASGDLGHFTFSATTVSAAIGSFLELDATKTIQFDSNPAPGGNVASFGKLNAKFNLPNNVSVTGSGQDFAVGADGSFRPGPTFGVSLSVSDSSTLAWPSWLPIQVQHVGVTWANFSADPANFALDLSASVNVNGLGGTGLTLGGSVQDAVFDVGKLEKGEFPITSIKGAGVSVGGNMFGAQVKGALFLNTLNLDKDYNIIQPGDTTTPVASSYLYGGVDAGLSLFGLGGIEIRIGLGEFGSSPSGIVLLNAFIDSSFPILLDPDTGLAITDLHAGIAFGQTLPPPTSPKDLATNPTYKPPGQLTLTQWEDQLAGQVATVAKNAAASGGNGGAPSIADLTQDMTIDAGATLFSEYASTYAFELQGDLMFDTKGHILAVGSITVGSEVSLTGGIYLDASQFAQGKGQILMYAEAPAQAPIATVYGDIGFHFGNDTPAPELGTGLSLNGTTDSASAPNVNLNNTSYTVEFWAKRADTGRAEYVVGQGDATTSTDLKIGFDASNNFVVSQGGNTLTYATTDGAWHHWAVTFDQTSGRVTVFEDGKAVATQSGFQPLQNTSTTFLVGQSGSAYFNGSVDEVRVWNVARSAADIQANYALTTPATTAGLVADWSFSEAKGTTAADSSGNNHTLTFQGSPSWALTQAQTPGAGSFSSFTITASGEVDLTLPDLPGALVITGSATFTVSSLQSSLDLSLYGTVNLDPLGNLITLAGTVHYDTAANGTPELYGIFALQTGQLSQLQQLGINVAGTAVLRFNTTNRQIPVTLPIASPGSGSGSTASGSGSGSTSGSGSGSGSTASGSGSGSTSGSGSGSGSTSTTYILPAQAVSLVIKGEADFQKGGQSWFALQGELDADFTFTQDAQGVHPQLQVYVGGTLLIGPTGSPYVSFAAVGFLQISDAGIAADINITVKTSDTLSKAGVTLKNDTLSLLLNTTGQEVKYTVPALTDPDQTGTVPGAGNQVDIPAQPAGASTPVSYLQIDGSGELVIKDSFDLSGSFHLLVSPGLLSFGLNMDFGLNAGTSQLLKLHVQGGMTLSNQGLVAGINLSLGSGLPSGYGFTINASYLLEVNTTGQDQTVGGLTVPAGKNGPYALVHAQGDLVFGSFDAHGSFDFQANATTVTIAAAASTTLGPLGSATINGMLTVQSGANAGLYGILQAALDSSPSIPALGLSAHFQFEINTTNIQQTVTGFTVNPVSGDITGNQSIAIGKSTIMVAAGGQLTIATLFNVWGEFDITVGPSGLDLNANATLKGFLGADLGLKAHLGIFGADAQGSGGVVVYAGLTLNGNLGMGIVSIHATPTLIINTSNVARNGIAANTEQVALNNVSANVLGFSASGSLTVGVSNGIFDIEVPANNPLNVTFFGLGGFSAYGYIKSNGQFSLTGSVGFSLGSSGNELWGSIDVTISNSGFSGSFSGGASVFGVTLASISGSLDIQNGYVHLGAYVKILFVGFGFDFTLGQLNIPTVPATISFFSVPPTAHEGDQVTLDASAYDSSGLTVGDSGYQWTIYRNGQVYASSTGAMYQPVLGDPGTYTVVLNAVGQTRTSTITVDNVVPVIKSVATQTGFAYKPQLTISPTVVDPGASDTKGGLSYNWVITKNGNPFQTITTNSQQLTFSPDQPPVPVMPAAGQAPPPPAEPDIYHLILTVTDTSGVSVSSAGDIAVFDPSNITVNTNQDLAAVTSGPNGTTLIPLRVALQAATTNGGGVSYVRFAPSLAGQTLMLDPAKGSGNTEISINSGLVYLDGSAAPGLTISTPGGSNERLFYVAHGAALDLNDLNLTGGNLYLQSQALGGAIYADGSVNAFNSAFYGNSVIATGNIYGNNYGQGLGGAVFVSGVGSLYALNTTFANNYAFGTLIGGGGAIWNGNYLALFDDTISTNNVGSNVQVLGAGIEDNVPNPIVGSSIVYRSSYGSIIYGNNGAPDVQINNNLEFFGNRNLVGSIVNTPVDYSGLYPFVYTSADPKLGPLTDHGDGVATFSLLPGSAAIAASFPGLAVNSAYDGRGYPRTFNNTQDIGAYQTQPYVVSNTNDSGPGSLRLAIAADDNGSPVTIATGLTGQEITLTGGPIEVKHSLVLTGPGANQLAINGNGTGRIFTVDPGVSVTLSGLTLSGGVAGQGGAILNSGNLTVYNSVFTNDVATAGQGGAIYNAGGASLTVNNSTFAFDSAFGNGSVSAARGGAVDNAAGATFSGLNDTFSNNAAQGASLYGTDGYNVVYDQAVGPAYASVNFANSAGYVWTWNTNDPRTLLRAEAGATGRIASAGYSINPSVPLTIDLNFTDGLAHQVSVYALDYDYQGRSERFDVVDAATGKVLDSRTLSSYTNGVYLRWVLQGHIQIQITNLSGPNALFSGLFFDPAPAGVKGPATFLGADTASQGNWESYPTGSGYGGAIDNAGSFTLVNSTIANNTAVNGTGRATATVSEGGGIENESTGTLVLYNSIVADDSGGHDLANVGSVSGGTNLVTSSSGLPGGVVSLTSDPKLGPLGNNGGPTPTLAPLPGSPAIDMGSNAAATTAPWPITNRIVWLKGDGNAVDSVSGATETSQNLAYGPGQFGQAFQLNGSSSSITVPNSPAQASSGFTVGGWFNLSQAPASGAEFDLISKTTDSYLDNGWVLRVDSSLVPRFSLSGPAISPPGGAFVWYLDAKATAPLALNTWNYLAATFDGTLLTLYVNGVAAGTAKFPYGYNTSISPIVVGAASWASGGGYTAGSVDDVMMFTRALNPSELLAAMAGSYTQPSEQRGELRTVGTGVDLGSVEAQPFLVTSTADSGPGSLRQAIAADRSGDGPIVFAPFLNGRTITLTGGPIEISHDLTIVGPGAGLLAISGGYSQGLFQVTSGNVSMSGLTLEGGLASQGGAVYNTGHLTVTNSVFLYNTAYNATGNLTGRGGALYNGPAGVLTVTGSTFNGNYAVGVVGPEGDGGRGGAIYNAPGGSLTTTDDTFASNGAEGVNGYGTDGYDILSDVTSFPAYAKVSFTGASPYVWAGSTTDPRGLQKADPGVYDRIAPSVNTLPPTNAMTVDVNLTDGHTHLVSIYAVDWDSTVRSERIDVVDPSTGKVLDSQTLSSFNGGAYLTWAITGHVQFVITRLAGSNAVISGLFFDPAPANVAIPAGAGAQASFVNKDVKTQGNWKANWASMGASFGGAIDNAGTATVASSTIDGNAIYAGSNSPATVSSDGSGLVNETGASLTLLDTIVAGGTSGHDVVNQGSVTGGHDLVTSAVGLPAGLVSVTADPKLGPLQNNGGPTPTMALLPGSPAVDAGDPTGAPATDQRGLARVAFATIDIGAYEFGAPLVVTSAADSGPGTLRQALAQAAQNTGAPITFAASLAGQTIVLASPLSVPAGQVVTIDGTTAPGLVLKGNGKNATDGSSRVLINAGTLVLRGLTLSGGYADNGGGLYNTGTLALQDSTVSGNTAYHQGGGVYNTGTLSVLDSTLANNTLAALAGQPPAPMGGGILNAGLAVLEGATISANVAPPLGSAQGFGGGVASLGGTLTLHDTIVYGNVSSPGDGQDLDVSGGKATSLGANIVGDTAGAYTPSTADLKGANPLLGALQDNGGPTYTMALPAGSPAVDAGDPTGAPATDQRGFLRASGQALDVGAYERQPYVVSSAADSGPGSLRQAVAADKDGSPVTFAPALAGQTIVLASPITLSNGLTVDGSAASGLVVSGGGTSRIFNVTAGASVTINALTLANGRAGQGGAIANMGALTLTKDLFTGDVAGGGAPGVGGPFGQGGAVYNAPGASLNVTGTTFSSDSALAVGAGSAGRGGAIYNAAGAALSATNDTFSGNTAVGANSYGTDGSNLFNSVGTLAKPPAYATVGFLNAPVYTWQLLSTDPRALLYPGSTNRIASAIYTTAPGNAMTIDVNLTDGNAHRVSLYAMDFDSSVRSERIDVVDPSTGKVLDSRSLSSFSGGVYLSWEVQGHVQFVVTNTGPSNALISGVFFDPLPPGVSAPAGTGNQAGFLGTDTATQGNWSAASGAGFGGAIDNAGTATLLDVTLANNGVAKGTGPAAASAPGGSGLANEPGATLAFSNTIVAGNGGGVDVLNLGAASGDHNLVTSNTGLPASTVSVTANPNLGPLQVNFDGTTPTLPLLAGSPALDAGNNAATTSPVLAIPGLAGWWKADGNAQDSSGAARNGTAAGGATYAPGMTNQAFSLNGQGAYVALPSSADIVGTGAFTASAWIKTTASGGVILQQRDPSNFNGEYMLSLSGGKVSFFDYGDYQYGFNFTSTKSVNDGAWHLVTGVRLANGTGQIYVDGALDSSQAAPPRTLGSGFNVYIGGDVRDNTNYFTGLIDEVTLYGAALNPSQVQSLYKGTTPPSADQNNVARIYNGTVDIGAVENHGFAPAADPGEGYIIHAGDSATFDAGDSVSPKGVPLTFSWDINGDGVFGDATGVSPTLTWAQLSALGITPRQAPYQVSVRIDDGTGPAGVIVSQPTALTVLPELGVAAIDAGPAAVHNTPVDSVEIMFTAPIDPSTLGSGAVTLTLDGGPNLIDGPITVTPVAGTYATYTIGGLSAWTKADGHYLLTVQTSKVSDSIGVGSDAGSASWLMDATAPTTRVAALPLLQNSLNFTVTASGSDPSAAPGVPGSGLAAMDLYVSINDGAPAYWTTVTPASPSAVYPGKPETTYVFFSIGRDAAGNVEKAPAQGQAATYVPGLFPVTRVTSVDASSPSLQVTYQGVDTGGNGLASVTVFAQVDGGAPQAIAESSSASGTVHYQAIVDGQPHTYRFFSIGTDTAGNVQPVPTDPSAFATVTAAFAPPAPPVPQATGLVVQHGAAERSYVRYIDLLFNNSAGLDALVAGGHVHLYEHDLNGTGSTPVPLNAALHVVDHAIEIDFGAGGIGGDPSSTAADGIYEVKVDGSPTTFTFDRLLGDLNGDGKVDGTDLNQVSSAILGRGFGQSADANGDGVVNATDRTLVRRTLGRRLL